MNAIPMLTLCMKLQNPAILLPVEGSCAPRDSTTSYAFNPDYSPPTDNGIAAHRPFELDDDESNALAQTGLTPSISD